MKKVIKYSPFLLVILLFASCKKNMHMTEYMDYVTNKENGLKKVQQVDGWEYTLQYRPYEYIMLMENKGEKENYDLVKRLSTLKGTAWFSIAFKRTDGQVTPLKYGVRSLEEYNTRLNYFLNEASKSIHLTYNNETLTPVSYLFENNYNLTPQETMMVGFYLPAKEDNPLKQMQLSFTDEVFKNGIIKAVYTEDALKNIPNLVY